ncbi:unnamed protein product [Brassica napus]|uniref:(rape) hypothetical protein n=1 Tax=Brassica napus TaxID=3708 RepID=A0A817BEE7_BRANA|nr:unnamed protein product [Brassica napus]
MGSFKRRTCLLMQILYQPPVQEQTLGHRHRKKLIFSLYLKLLAQFLQLLRRLIFLHLRKQLHAQKPRFLNLSRSPLQALLTHLLQFLWKILMDLTLLVPSLLTRLQFLQVHRLQFYMRVQQAPQAQCLWQTQSHSSCRRRILSK